MLECNFIGIWWVLNEFNIVKLNIETRGKRGYNFEAL